MDKFQTFERLPLKKNIKRYGEGGLRINGFYKSSKPNHPLISLITVIYNGEKYLQETLDSIARQSYLNFEHIVVDGGSKDKTLEIIKNNSNKIDYWVSEDDDGIYDAFNKGMQLCRGEYLGFINSDDVYEKDALNILVKYIRQNKNNDFIFGSVKKHWAILSGYRPWKIFYSWGFYTSHSTGFFIKNNSAKIVGFYNLKYKFSSDYDYLYRMIIKHKMNGVATKKNEIFGIFRRGGYSSKISFIDHFFEEIKIRIDNKQNRFLILFVFIYKFIKNLNKI